MSLDTQIKADAKAFIDQDGTQVTYTSSTLGTLTIYAFPTDAELMPRRSDGGRTTHRNLVIAVSKTDVSTVAVNADTVTVPGWWVDETNNQTLRVSRVLHRFDRGKWLLQLG